MPWKITAATPNGCAKAAQTILGATVEGRKIVGVRFSYSDVELDYLGRRTSRELKLRMSVYGQRGQSSVIAHGIAESMGTLTGYLCKVSPNVAEGVDRVSVKARY